MWLVSWVASSAISQITLINTVRSPALIVFSSMQDQLSEVEGEGEEGEGEEGEGERTVSNDTNNKIQITQ
jgi:hypothetical protein